MDTLIEILPSDGAIYIIRMTDFGGSFRSDIFDELDRFIDYCEMKPEFFFLDKDLEELRNKLHDEIGAFADKLSHKSFPLSLTYNRGNSKSGVHFKCRLG